MREFNRRRSPRDEKVRLGLKACGVLVLLLVTAVLSHAAWGMYTKMAEASQGQEEAESQLASLQAQQEGVSNTLGELSTQRGVETQMRERYGVAKPGEGEIDIVADEHASTTATTTPESWWQRLFKVFKVW